MFEYDTVNRWVLRRLRKVSSDGADVTSGGRHVYNNNNNNNNNKHDNVYGAVIMAEPLREFTRFIWWM